MDDYVLDEDGVLDLREFERDPVGASVADPAKALAGIRGQLGNAHEVSELYDESQAPRSRWRLGRRTRHSLGDVISEETAEIPETTVELPGESPILPPRDVPPLSRLSVLPPVPDSSPPPTVPIAESIEPEIDLRDEGRPTADCPKCMGLGHRDLFDRFSQVEFYSCDNCMHMWQQDLG